MRQSCQQAEAGRFKRGCLYLDFLAVDPKVMRVTPVVLVRDRSLLEKCAGCCVCQTALKGHEGGCGLSVTGE